ncbi:thermonuclease family protein [Prochlorococcus sp. MIT 0801]|uniref:thermonuclease family protein n=1 Tax=Prochlorococcus sp. MIT 0801 TaxID=1501269 RepID=UPI0004F70E20|nr:thermonuclease family protein [Prochlorococcus sp. MIT 0801]AIQ97396.1 nuclease (SNase-like) protein [Prochlorococcus sp. MIT 0801]
MDVSLRQKLIRKLLNQGGEKGFSLIELLVVIAVLAVLISTSLIKILDITRKSEKVIAQNSILRIKSECEANKALNETLNFSQINIRGYDIDSDYSNSCNGNPVHGFINLIPTTYKSNPSFHYQFNKGQITCSIEKSELTPFPECHKIIQLKKKYKCGDIGDWSKAQQLLIEGHSYLDRDNDGEACETLGRKSNKPEIGSVTIQSCYDGDTCTTSQGEKIRLACIDTPEIRGRRSDPIPAKAARDYLNNLVKGKEANIRRVTEDRYGRTVAELTIDGINLQQNLVNEGHATIYRKYSKPCSWANK